MLTRALKEFQWRLGSLRHFLPASGVQRVRHDILGRSGPYQVRTSPEIFRRNYLSHSRRQTFIHSGNRMFSTNSVHPDSSDVSVFIGSEDLPGSTSLSNSKPVYAGTAAGANATGPPTAVYLNPAHQAHLQADSTSVATKTVYLIRHGEGWHNIGYDHNLDPHLTPRGWAQTAALQQHLAALQPQLGIELVVVSPLRRTLETAAGVFGAANPPPMQAAAAAATAAGAGVDPSSTGSAAAAQEQPGSSWVLMKSQPDKPNEITRRAMIYLPPIAAAAAAAAAAAPNGNDCSSNGVNAAGGSSSSNGVHQPLPLLAHEGCRERIGPNVCDRFRDIPLQKEDFPGVNFDLMYNQTDVNWECYHEAICQDGGCYLTGEEESATERRALDFYNWIMSRPEQRIAVVSHCGFLCHGMRALGKTMLQVWNESMLQQCNMQAAAKTAAVATYDASSNQNSNRVLDIPTAEAVRVSAGDVAGRMSADWMNCEMRSIQLCWGPELFRNSSSSAGGSGAAAVMTADGLIDRRGWLWATAGDGTVWFPGGFYGL